MQRKRSPPLDYVMAVLVSIAGVVGVLFIHLLLMIFCRRPRAKRS